MNGAEPRFRQRTDPHRVLSAVARAAVAIAGGVALGMLVAATARAQPSGLSASVFVRPNPSPYLTDWERDPQSAYVNVVYAAAPAVDYRIEAFVRVNGTEAGRVRSPVLSFLGPATQLFGLEEVIAWSTVSRDTRLVDVALRTGTLPEGRVALCVQVTTPSGAPLGEPQCVEREIRLPEAPQLLLPANGGTLTALRPVFQWMPIAAAPGSTLQYRLRIVERQPEQVPAVAMRSNPVHFEQLVAIGSPILPYPADALPLRDDRQYVWQVDIVDALGRVVTRGGQSSELWSFQAGDVTRPVAKVELPRELELVPDAAYLVDLDRATATATNNEFGVTLDGPLTLRVLAPFELDIPVQARGLVLDRLRLPSVRILGGVLEATRITGDVPDLLTGRHVVLSDVRLRAGEGLTFGVALRLPGQAPVPMDGRVGLTLLGFAGEPQLRRTFFRSAPGPVQVELDRARVTYPAGRLTVGGRLALFEQAVQCSLSLADDEGRMRIVPSCPERVEVEIAGGAQGLGLLVRGLRGAVVLDPAAGSSSYQIRGAGQLRFARRALCGGTFDFTVEDGKLSRSEPETTCDAGDVAFATLGGLEVRPISLGVTRFDWQPGSGFDYDLRIGLRLDAGAVSFPTIPGAQLTPAGVTVTAVRAEEDRDKKESLGAFSWPFSRTESRIAAGTVSWAQWADSTVPPFDIRFDGALGLPQLVQNQLPRDCAWGQRVPFSDARLEPFRVRIPVDGAVSPGCVLPLSTDSAPGFLVERVRGTMIGELLRPSVPDPAEPGLLEQVLQERRLVLPSPEEILRNAIRSGADLTQGLPTLEGSFLIRDLFRCTNGGIQRLPVAAGARLTFAMPDGGPPRPIVVATVSNVNPTCPIELPGLRITSARGTLRLFDAGGTQGATFEADVAADLLLAQAPQSGSGRVVFDLIRGRVLSGAVAFQGPLRLDLPRESPMLQVEVNALDVGADGLRIDGRATVAPALPSGGIGATFDRIVLDATTLAVTSGRITIDAPFALDVGFGVGQTNALTAQLVAANAAFEASSGMRLTLPGGVTISPDGIAFAGSATARLRHATQDFADLSAMPVDGFRLQTVPLRVGQGRLDLTNKGVRLAWVDRLGFHPDFAGIASLLPDRLPLPLESVAYLQIRDPQTRVLLVRTTPDATNADRVTIATEPGKPVQLVLPAAQTGATAPSLNVEFSLVLDRTTQQPVSGRVVAVLPPKAPLIDFAALGLPFALDQVVFEQSAGGAWQLALLGRLVLFGTPAGPNAGVRLAFDDIGNLSANVDLRDRIVVPFGTGARDPRLTVTRLSGSIDVPAVRLPAGVRRPPAYWQVTGRGTLSLDLGAGERWEGSAALTLNDQELAISDVTTNRTEWSAELAGARVRVRNVRWPRIAWNAVARRVEFETRFDASLQLPQLPASTLPEIADITLTHERLVLPATTFPDLGAATVAWNGFSIRPLAIRLPRTVVNWQTGTIIGAGGFRVDLGVRLAPAGEQAVPGFSGVELTAQDLGFDRGYLVGDIVARQIGGAPLVLGAGSPFRLTIASARGVLQVPSALPTDPLAPRIPDIRVDVAGQLDADPVQCPGTTNRTVSLPTGALRITSSGQVRGTVSNVVPPCPISLGGIVIEATASTIGFGVPIPGGESGSPTPAVWMSGAFTARAAATSGAVGAVSAVSLTGQAVLDVGGRRLVSGSLALSAPLTIGVPATSPVLRLTASEGILSASGLTLTGSGSLEGTGTPAATVAFSSLRLNPAGMSVSGGEATITGSLALTGTLGTGGLLWTVGPATSPTPTGTYARLVTPSALSLTSSGLRLTGTATASAGIGTQVFAGVSAAFADDFTIGLSPVAVTQGRADLRVDRGAGPTRVAWVEAAGIFPDIAGAVAVALPDSIPLPSFGIAYVRLPRSGPNAPTGTPIGNDRVQVSAGPIAFVLPGLAGLVGAGPLDPPTVMADASFVYDTRTGVVVSGTVTARPGTGASIIPLPDGAGIDLRAITFGVANGTARVQVAGRARLPASLAKMNLRFDDLTLTSTGLSGTVEAGTYDGAWVPGRTAIAADTVLADGRDSVFVSVTGARLELGASSRVLVSGTVRATMLEPPGASSEQRPVFFTGVASSAGLAMTASVSSLPGGALTIGPATFNLEAVDGAPALGLVASSTEFRLSASGVLRVPALGPNFEIGLADFRIGTTGVQLPRVVPRTRSGIGVFGATIALGNPQSTGALLSLEREASGRGVVLVVDGRVLLQGDPSTGALVSCPGTAASQQARVALRIGSTGTLSGRLEDVVPRCPLTLGVATLRPGALTIGINSAPQAGQTPRPAWIRGAMTLELDGLLSGNGALAGATGRATATATGTIGVDLATGRVFDGQLAIASGLEVDLPIENPFLRFRGLTGGLDSRGIFVHGSGTLAVDGLPSPVAVTFDSLRFSLESRAITGGSATIASPAALQVRAGDSGLDWALVAPATPLPSGVAVARLTLPSSITLTADGLALSGSELAMTLGAPAAQPRALATQFVDGFRIGLAPLRVEQGRADFLLPVDPAAPMTARRRIAYLDARGFAFDDVLAALPPLPARIPLPDVNVAWLELPRDGNGLVDMELNLVGSKVRLSSRANRPARFGIPALAEPAAAGTSVVPPAFDVTVTNLVIDGRTFAVESGVIEVAGANGAPLLSLASRGLPVSVERVRFAAATAGPAVTASLRVDLPSTLLAQPVQFSDVALGPNGLAGSLTVGTVDDEYVPGRPVLGSASSGTLTGPGAAGPLTVALTGVRLTLGGANAGVRVNGTVTATPLVSMAPTGDAPPLFFAGAVTPQGAQLDLAPVGGTRTFAIGPAELVWRAVGAAPALRLEIGAQGAAVVASGTFRVPSLSATLALDVERLRIADDGVTIGAARVQGATGAEMQLGPWSLGLKDTTVGPQPVYPTVHLSRDAQGVWVVEVDGRVTLRSEALSGSMAACGGASLTQVIGASLRVTSAGQVRGRLDNVAPRCPVMIGAVRVIPGAVSVGLNAPLPASAPAGETSSLWLDGAVTVELPLAAGAAPAAAGTPASGAAFAGQILVDITGGRVLAGSLSLARSVRLGLPAAKPVLTFEVSQATLDQRGITLGGSGTVALGNGATVGVGFEDLSLRLSDLAVSAGRATLTSSVALTAAVEATGLSFKAEAANAAPPEGTYARLTLPANIAIDRDGLSISGTAQAALKLGSEPLRTADVAFLNGFRLGLGSTVAVNRGQADFRIGSDRIAILDAQGLRGDNVIAVAAGAIPDSLPLGGFDVAYVRLKKRPSASEAPVLVVETTLDGSRRTIATKASETATLVLPSLRPNPAEPYGAGNRREIEVAFSLDVHAQTLAPMGGSIVATAAASSELFRIGPAGGSAPAASVTRLGFEVAAGAFALRLSGAVTLPAPLASLRPAFENLVVGPSGLSGTIRVGQYGTTYDASRTSLPGLAWSVGGEAGLRLAVQGAELDLPANGGAPVVRISGTASSALFAPPALGSEGGTSEAPPTGQTTAPLFFSGSVAGTGMSTLTVAATAGGQARLPIGGAFFEPSALRLVIRPAVGATAAEAAVGLDGTLRMENIAPGLAATITNLELSSTRGVVLPDVAVNTTTIPPLTLFGLTFTLADQVCATGAPATPALRVSRASGVVRLSLAGTLQAFGNTTSFCGLRVGSDGGIGLDGARLLRDSVVLAQNLVALRTLDFGTAAAGASATPNATQPALSAEFGFTLPAPLSGRPRQTARITIRRDGSITGGATVVLINETNPDVATNDLVLGSAVTIRPRRLAVALDFADFVGQSKVQAVVDMLVHEKPAENGSTVGTSLRRVRFGSLVNGVPAGQLELGFNGSFSAPTVSLDPQPFDITFEALRLTVSSVAGPQAGSNQLFTMSGSVGLTLPSVEASLGFSDFSISKTGQVALGAVTDGSLSVAGIFTGTLTAPVLIRGPQIVRFRGGESATTCPQPVPPTGPPTPADYDAILRAVEDYRRGKVDTPQNAADDEVAVDFLLCFGGTVSVKKDATSAPLLNGGIKQFLLMRTYHTDPAQRKVELVVRDASLEISNVVSVNANLRYSSRPGGFDLLVKGSAKVKPLGGSIALYGMVEQRSSPVGDEVPLRAGLFVAVSGAFALPLIPPATVAYLTGIGGGFFYRPRPNVFSDVATMVGMQPLSRAEQAMLTSGGAGFAVMLYAEVKGPDPTGTVFEGKALISVTAAGFAMQGQFDMLRAAFATSQSLGPDNADRIKLRGTLVLGWRPVAFRGSVEVDVRFAGGKVTADGRLAVVVAPGPNGGPVRWAVVGQASVRVLDELIQATTTVAVSPNGFFGAVDVKVNLPLGVVKIDGLEVKVFLKLQPAPVEFGAYGRLQITAYPLLLPEPKFSLYIEGAFMTPPPMLYVGAGIPDTPFGVWVKVSDPGGVTAGLGRDPALQQLIENAQKRAMEMATAATDAAADMRTMDAGPVPLTSAELGTAFASLSRLLELPYGTFQATPAEAENWAVITNPEALPQSPAATAFFNDWIQRTASIRRPGQETQLRAALARAADSVVAMRALLTAAATRLQRVAATIAPFSPGWLAPVVVDPLSVEGLEPLDLPEVPTTEADLDKVEVRSATGGPTFAVNARASSTNRAATSASLESPTDAAAARARLLEVEAALQSAERALYQGATATEAPPISMAGRMTDRYFTFDSLLTEIGAYYQEARLRAQQALAWLGTDATRPPGYAALIDDKNAIAANLDTAAVVAWARDRVDRVGRLLGDPSRVATFDTELAASSNRMLFARDRARAAGIELYLNIPIAGYTATNAAMGTALNRLQNAALPSLRTYRSVAEQLTTRIDAVVGARANLAGVAYDLYDRLLLTDGTLTEADRARFQARKDSLAALLLPPGVSDLATTSVTTGYRLVTTYTWRATHASGIAEVRFKDAPASDPARGYLSLGRPVVPQLGVDPFGRTTFELVPPAIYQRSTFRFAGLGGPEGDHRRQVSVQARGPLGSLGTQGSRFDGPILTPPPATFTGVAPALPPQGTVSGSAALDQSPPQFSFARVRPGTVNDPSKVQWVTNSAEVTVEWSATDPESGINSAVVSLEVAGATVDGRTVAGREFVTFSGLNVPSASVNYRFAVRARNGAGLERLAYTPYVRFDPSPPYFVQGPGTTVQATTLIGPPNDFGVPGPDGERVAPQPPPAVTRAACTEADRQSARSPEPLSAQLPPLVGLVSVSFAVPAVGDLHSGIAGLAYRLDTVPVTAYDPATFTAIAPGVTTFSVPSPSTLAAFRRTWRVWVVAIDRAGRTSTPVSSLGFVFPEPSPPTAPAVCLFEESGELKLLMLQSSWSSTGTVVGYQFSIWRDGVNVQPYYASPGIDVQALPRGGVYTLGPAAATGGTYRVGVRAVTLGLRGSAPVVTGDVMKLMVFGRPGGRQTPSFAWPPP